MLERAMRRHEGSASFSPLTMKGALVQAPCWQARLQQGLDSLAVIPHIQPPRGMQALCTPWLGEELRTRWPWGLLTLAGIKLPVPAKWVSAFLNWTVTPT